MTPPRLAAPNLEWHAMRTCDGSIRVQARNTGQSHVKLGQLDIAAGSTAVATRNVAEYVLPDNQREWLVAAKAAPPVGTVLSIASQADVGLVQANVTLEDDPRELNPTTPQTAAR